MKKTGPTKRQLQAMDTKSRIFEAAMELGAKIGYESLNINEICNAAGVSVGTFYHYFSSIDAVFQEQYVTFDRYFSAAIEKAPLSGSFFQDIRHLFTLKYEYVSERGPQFIVRQYRGQFSQVETENAFFYSKNRIMHTLLLETLRKGIFQGELKLSAGMTPEFFADSFLVFSRGITVDWALKNANYDLKERGIRMLNIMLQPYLIGQDSTF
nr:TetR/AcrR family transcriptional regulator [uncultured Oscillibacter sp.]